MKEDLLLRLIEKLIDSDSTAAVNEVGVTNLDYMHQGEYVLVRTYSAGVHFGKLVKRAGKELVLDEARRIWSWDGAFTLSAVSVDGVGSAKVSTKVNQFLVTEAIEVMLLTEKAKGNLYGLQDYNG